MRISRFGNIGLLTKITIFTFFIAVLTVAVLFLTSNIYFQALAISTSFLLLLLLIRVLLSPLKKIVAEIKLVSEQKLHPSLTPQSADELAFLTASFTSLIRLSEDLGRKINYDQDLIASEKGKLQAIIDSISNSILVLDLHRQIIMSNKAAKKDLGYAEGEMTGKSIDKLITITEKSGREILAKEYCPIDLSGHGLTPSYKNTNIVTIKGKDDKSLDGKILSSPVIEGVRANLGCVLIVRDSSDELQLESMQLDFVSMASHELRTPVTSIIGYLNVLIDEGKDKFTPEHLEFLNRVLASANQMSALINNLLSVSKVERGVLSVSTVPTDLQKLLIQVVENSQPQAAQKNISLDFVYPKDSLPQVLADPLYVTEVANNLITNAIKYTEGGGWIKIEAKPEGAEIITSVADNGRGIPKEAIPKLFTKFFRVATAADRASSSKGTGLGLYISKSIIEMLKGRIWVESEVGKGSVFFFSLPTAQQKNIGVSFTTHNNLYSNTNALV